VHESFSTIAQALAWAVGRLRQQGIDNPRLDAEILLAHCMNGDRVRLYRDAQSPLAKECRERFLDAIARRAGREPVAYITGIKEFRSCSFRVSPHVLIPRPETETIIEVMLQLHATIRKRHQGLRLLEVGTGSGIIAVSLAQELADVWICATDCDPIIVEIARANAHINRVDHKIAFLAGNLLNCVRCRDGAAAFDCILSNPPYLSDDEWNMAQPEIRYFEPERALRSGPDGLSFYRLLVPEAGRLLRKNGHLLLEIGRGQSAAVARLMGETGLFGPVATAKDLSGTERVIMAQRQ
jgi:release factor glutamine methyltransferase